VPLAGTGAAPASDTGTPSLVLSKLSAQPVRAASASGQARREYDATSLPGKRWGAPQGGAPQR